MGLPVILQWTHCPFVIYVFCSSCTPLGCKKGVSGCLLGAAFYTISTKTTLWISFFHSWISLRGQDVLNGSTIWLYLKAILFHLPASVFRPFVRLSFSQVRKSESRWWALFFPCSLSLCFFFFFCLLPIYTLVWINDMTLARQNSTMCPSYSIFSIWERERNLRYLTGQRFRPKNDLARLSFSDNVYLMSHRDHREWVNVCENETERAVNVGWEQKRENKWEAGG